jgi:hypothetical protein
MGPGPEDEKDARLRAYVRRLAWDVRVHGEELPKRRAGDLPRDEDSISIATPFEGDSATGELEEKLRPAIISYFSALPHDNMSNELILFLDGKTYALARAASIATCTWSYSDQEGQTKSDRGLDRLLLDLQEALEATLLEDCPAKLSRDVKHYAGRIAKAISDAMDQGLEGDFETLRKPLPDHYDN